MRSVDGSASSFKCSNETDVKYSACTIVQIKPDENWLRNDRAVREMRVTYNWPILIVYMYTYVDIDGRKAYRQMHASDL